jgi:hypothetical protein
MIGVTELYIGLFIYEIVRSILSSEHLLLVVVFERFL